MPLQILFTSQNHLSRLSMSLYYKINPVYTIHIIFNISFFFPKYPKCPHVQPLATLTFSSDVQAVVGLSSPVRRAMAVGTSSRRVAPWPPAELAGAHEPRLASGGELVLRHAFGWSSRHDLGLSPPLRRAMAVGTSSPACLPWRRPAGRQMGRAREGWSVWGLRRLPTYVSEHELVRLVRSATVEVMSTSGGREHEHDVARRRRHDLELAR
jgi:hypothetical protein